MHRIELFVFDMAGTVVNEQNIVYKTLHYALFNNGYSQISLADVLKDGAGKEKLKAIQDLMIKADGFLDLEKSHTIYVQFQSQLEHNYAIMEINEQPNATKLFHYLKSKGVKVALNTGYNSEIATMLIKRLKWEIGRDIDALVTADDAQNHRPEPDMIIKAAEICKVALSHTAKVGDSAIDIYEGRNAKCAINIGVTTGAQTREQLSVANPDYIFDDLWQISEIV